MQGVPASFDNPTDVAEFLHPAGRPGVELYRAHIVRHAFEPHIHEGFGLGAIESGVERFRYAGTEHLAPPDSIVLMNPDELHTGRAETNDGWRYRMIYIEPGALAEVSGEPNWWFSSTVVDDDRTRARRVSGLLDALWRAGEPLAFDSLLLRLVDELRPHACVPVPARDEKSMRFAPVLDYMRARLDQRLSLEELAALAGLSPFHFLRRFQAQYHATPQQMLMAFRLSAAKRLLTAGEAPAQVAAATGLTDQAHLTRAFARRYGITPGRYQRQLRT
jgi:AraC-like DNA-binding protein